MSLPQFSKLIAGTMTWGSWGKNCSVEQMTALIHNCVDLNIHSFDHADIYGDYTTEKAFGSAFKASGIQREKLQFISKCGIQLRSPTRQNKIVHYDYRKSYIIQSVEQSLKNLQTDYLDVLLLHRPSPLMNPEIIAEALDQLLTEGKILAAGLSNFTASQTALLNAKTKVNYNQIEFSLTQATAMLDGNLDYMQLHDIKPMCWSPLGTVFSEDTSQTTRIKAVAQTLADKYNLSLAGILLAWILKHPAGIIPVFGTTNSTRMEALTKACDVQLDQQDWFALWTASTGTSVP